MIRRGLAFIAVAVVAVVAVVAIRDLRRGYRTAYGAKVRHVAVHSRLVHRDLHEIVVVPQRHERWLLILLHGRGSSPASWLDQRFFDALHSLGPRAPIVLLLDGGDHSYWHDRADGKWGSMVYAEGMHVVANARKVAIGGISMGGFGALRLGVVPLFCAVGAHSPALWFRAGDTPAGAFDDAVDFARNDLLRHRVRYRAPVWIDVGTDDPFHDAAVAYAHKIHAQLHVWPGGHEHSYWSAHMRSYFQFYARNCG